MGFVDEICIVCCVLFACSEGLNAPVTELCCSRSQLIHVNSFNPIIANSQHIVTQRKRIEVRMATLYFTLHKIEGDESYTPSQKCHTITNRS